MTRPFTNFKLWKYCQNGPIFNGVYSENKLHKKKDRTYAISFDEFKSKRTNWKLCMLLICMSMLIIQSSFGALEWKILQKKLTKS